MYKKIKKIISSQRDQNSKIISQNNEIILQNQELIWAESFHDAIKGYSKIKNLPLNIGRWAGNYTFFYILFRILNDLKPKKILELGLGESSKFITTFIKYYLQDANHLVLEQDEEWKNSFLANFKMSHQSEIIISPTIIKNIRGFNVEVYDSIENIIDEDFDFYLIDGPKGSEHYSRYDAYKIVQSITNNQNFMILLDDYDRLGEQETVSVILKELEIKEIKYNSAVYTGVKKVIVIASEKYKSIKGF